ncbi:MULTISPECIES: DUF3515 domain-containing protein [Streptomyces]|uniref:DUF3515 domain-containing protein n=1 Tax=Streptomyces albus (strain ATCC 21838 / DSM 41398 / FERM P-419 / JCM 4703 / NBRC 107858) TaxID=1081613 RepID=A0A0B5EVF5_STRA4|nr:DUF3515 domain-containing protein [Streptomyces sp. SCSIO ZS0520]AJE82052.1 hypothetical protein SLNWT_1676 [Streptomyces albus]AOU76369.1 hypothetical protein SLNHY_1678 [Streptomyces albus]AYN32154.1 DUF3515 domain-containing protein [Streptomyces albus]
MNFSLSRRPAAAGPPAALALLLLATACTSGDGGTEAEVPAPRAEAARLCRDLGGRLPREVAGDGRNDPRPRSELTAGWGDPAIILRCGVERPAKMDDLKADGVEVDGVGWLLEKQQDGSFRFTTARRKAYVEVTIPEGRTGEGLAPLTDFAAPISRTVPKGIASRL